MDTQLYTPEVTIEEQFPFIKEHDREHLEHVLTFFDEKGASIRLAGSALHGDTYNDIDLGVWYARGTNTRLLEQLLTHLGVAGKRRYVSTTLIDDWRLFTYKGTTFDVGFSTSGPWGLHY